MAVFWYVNVLGSPSVVISSFDRNAERESISWLILQVGNGNVWMRPQIFVLEAWNSFAQMILFLQASWKPLHSNDNLKETYILYDFQRWSKWNVAVMIGRFT